MARTGKRYWELEKPIETRMGSLVMKHYPRAGVIQFYNWVETENYKGLSKGVSFHMDEHNLLDVQKVQSFLNTACNREGDERDIILQRQEAVAAARAEGATFTL